ncbi:hypothetical protein HK27_13005 [Acetobacter orientalis]|uniref:hypothetical protein n=1 Tax=Acetobacter orientalis TaxID=146474 RepID=UPI000A3B7E93|nr:hypothetical protein [Acetobacter orientalis]OUJ14855.1 hypothetical protein HK27_13005 [Acetobacter orientalis]
MMPSDALPAKGDNSAEFLQHLGLNRRRGERSPCNRQFKLHWHHGSYNEAGLKPEQIVKAVKGDMTAEGIEEEHQPNCEKGARLVHRSDDRKRVGSINTMNATTLGTRMTVKKEAAFHEAGHAVAAHLSKFHAILGGINLENYGAGEIFVSLSRRKLVANGKAADASSARDKEVVADLVVVLSAGVVAERIAEMKDSDLSANPQSAEPDHELIKAQLESAGLPEKFDRHEEAAKRLLEENWDLVNELAEYLFENKSVEVVDLLEFIEAKTA